MNFTIELSTSYEICNDIKTSDGDIISKKNGIYTCNEILHDLSINIYAEKIASNSYYFDDNNDCYFLNGIIVHQNESIIIPSTYDDGINGEKYVKGIICGISTVNELNDPISGAEIRNIFINNAFISNLPNGFFQRVIGFSVYYVGNKEAYKQLAQNTSAYYQKSYTCHCSDGTIVYENGSIKSES